MKFLLLSFLLLTSTYSYAKESLALVLSTTGTVKVKNGIKKKRVKRGSELSEKTLLLTSKNATAVVGMRDGSQVVLDENSILQFISNNEITQKQGAVYYKIASRDVKNRLRVKTDFAIIGIKGTRFIVNSDDKKNVLLKSGKVGIESPTGQFALYKEKEMAEFEAFKAKTDKEFEEYKAEQMKEFVGYVKEFDLSQGSMVSFDGKNANSAKMNRDAKKQFSKFEKLLR